MRVDIHGARNTKANLRDKQLVFRIAGASVYAGTVKHVENDGFWIDSPTLIAQMQEDQLWGPMVKKLPKPVIFVPTSALMFLIAGND